MVRFCLFIFLFRNQKRIQMELGTVKKKTNEKKTVDNNNVMVDRFSLFVANCNAAARIGRNNEIFFGLNSFLFSKRRIHLIILCVFFLFLRFFVCNRNQ